VFFRFFFKDVLPLTCPGNEKSEPTSLLLSLWSLFDPSLQPCPGGSSSNLLGVQKDDYGKSYLQEAKTLYGMVSA
jgi:hypothetical protein